MLEAGYSADATDRARGTVESWERFCEENRDEITALEILYARRQPQRLTFREVKELAQAIEQPPHRWTPERLWEAYEALDRSKVRGSGERVLTDLVSLVRVALHQEDELVPYPELVRERYRAWLLQQENAGRVFTPEQLAWLERIRDHVAASLGISADDFALHAVRRVGRAREGGAGLRRRPRPAARGDERGARHVSELPAGGSLDDARRAWSTIRGSTVAIRMSRRSGTAVRAVPATRRHVGARSIGSSTSVMTATALDERRCTFDPATS